MSLPVERLLLDLYVLFKFVTPTFMDLRDLRSGLTPFWLTYELLFTMSVLMKCAKDCLSFSLLLVKPSASYLNYHTEVPSLLICPAAVSPPEPCSCI